MTKKEVLERYGVRSLLNIDANAKTVKGQKRGYMTAVMYLAPYKAAGINVCPMAELASCWKGCLNTAGRGGIAKDNATLTTPAGELPDNAIQRARIKRTRFYADDRQGFMLALEREIRAFVRKAERKGLTPVVRLNGTSDIQFEIGHPVGDAATIFDAFPDVQFYDYTKIAKRFDRRLPDNYRLCLSYSEASDRYADMCRTAQAYHGVSLVIVARDETVKQRMIAEHGPGDLPAVDGDETDLRFTDPAGATVYLKAKGNARKDTSGFVLDW